MGKAVPSGPRFIGSEIYRASSYGSRHPLAIPRVSTVIDLCRLLGWLPDESYIDSPRATPAQLARFHDPDYVAAVMTAEREQRASEAVKARFNIGLNGNPVFPEIFRRPATACGASILAGELLGDGGAGTPAPVAPAPVAPTPGVPTIVFSPAGGTHHGQRDRASGFCFFNDPVLAILTLLDQGLERVFYLDVDAHHGDGVQIALQDNPRVATLSVHEAGRWPMGPSNGSKGLGTAEDRGRGRARNLPVPPGFNDAEMDLVLEQAIFPSLESFDPSAVVLQCGADGLADDPMSKLALSNRALWRVVAAVKARAPRLLVLGGGGYNPWSVARCWAGVWATLAGHSIPERLPEPGEALLRRIAWRHRLGRTPPPHWFETLADPTQPQAVREEVRQIVRLVMAEPLVENGPP